MSARFAPGTVPRPRFEVRVRRSGGLLTVGLDNDTFQLSDTAAFLFRQVDGTRTVSGIAQLLAAEYDIDPKTALFDTAELLEDLCDLRLIRVAAEVP